MAYPLYLDFYLIFLRILLIQAPDKFSITFTIQLPIFPNEISV